MQRTAGNSTTTTTTSTPPPKRLLFDRRYGWVLDEWKEPSQEALSGGRGMFCILPLGRALLKKASESIPLTFGIQMYYMTLEPQHQMHERGLSNLFHIHKYLVNINFVGSFALNVLERPEVARATLSDQMHKIASSVKNAELVLIPPKRNDERESGSTFRSSDLPGENSESHNNL